MKKLIIAASIASTALLAGCSGTQLKSSNATSFAGFEMRAPYVNYSDYFGYVDQNVKPDGKYKGKDAYYLYLWVPAAIDELGVSMVSPAPKEPAEGDFIHPNFNAGMEADSEAFFDTYLALDRLSIVDPTKIKDGGKVLQSLNTNDDNSDLDANPSGRKYNSLLRQVSDVSDPMKALVRGVYRVAFTSFRGSVKGSFDATVGTNIPGVVISESLEQLHELVNAAPESGDEVAQN
jgi:Surface lipoprotein of Spirochaetales order